MTLLEVVDVEIEHPVVHTEVNVPIANQVSCLDPTNLADLKVDFTLMNYMNDTKAENYAAPNNNEENSDENYENNDEENNHKEPTDTSSSSGTYSQRIKCCKCDRKCVNKSDMDCHILLWHSDYFPLRVPSPDVK